MPMSPEEWLASQQQTAPPPAPVEPGAVPEPTAPQSPEEWLTSQQQVVLQRNPNATMKQLEESLVQARSTGDANYIAQLERVIAEEKESNPVWNNPDIYESAVVQATVPEKPDPTVLEKIKGGAEAALTTLTGVTGGAAGFLGGTLKQLISEVESGEFGTVESADRVEQAALQGAQEYTYAPRGEVGQEYAQEVGEFAQQLAPLPGVTPQLQVAAQSAKNIPTVIRAARAPTPAPVTPTAALPPPVKPTPAPVTPTAALPPPVKPTPAPAAPVTAAVKKVTKPIVDIVTQEGKKKLAREIKADPYNADFASFKVSGNKAVKYPAAESALKQGWRPGFVQSVKASDAADMSAYRKMMNIYKIGKKNERFRQENRPADVVGKTFSDRVNKLFTIKKQAVKELDTAANKLKDKNVDHKPAFNKFEERLKEIGVKIERDEKGKPSFSLARSDIQGDAASETLLKRVFTRLGEEDFQTGYDLHRAKRWIDTQVDFSKKHPSGLANVTANIVKDLRRDINEALRKASPAYKKANIKYKDSLDSLADVQKAVGTTKDITGTHADATLGQEARVLLSKYGKRNAMRKTIVNAEEVVKKYGGKVEGDITGQIIFANELDHMFGDVASGSMRAFAQQAGKTGIEEFATKSRENLAIDLMKGAYKKIKRINEDNAIKSMEQLIKEK